MSTEQLLYKPQVPQATLTPSAVQLSQSLPQSPPTCCSAPETASNLIPYKDIVWAERVENGTKITYTWPSQGTVRIETITVDIDESVDKLMQKAYPYGHSPSVLVLVNPFGGKGTAKKALDEGIIPVLRAAHVTYTCIETQRKGHAIDIAREMDIDRYDIVACLSGDGIPHEVINGFYQRPDRGLAAFNKVAVTQIPGGSGNAFALSTHGSNDPAIATVCMLKAKKSKMDLMAMTNAAGTHLSFLSQCYGLIVQSDIGTEWMRWIGPKRFEIGTFWGVVTRARYPCDIYVKYLHETNSHVQEHFRAHSQRPPPPPGQVSAEQLSPRGPKLSDAVPPDWTQIDPAITRDLSLFYVGKMPYVSDNVQFFPAALPNDHAMDLVVMDTHATTMETVNVLTQADKGTHVNSDKVVHCKVEAYRLIPRREDLVISVDGESFPGEEFQVEVLPGVLTVLLGEGGYVETVLKQKNGQTNKQTNERSE